MPVQLKKPYVSGAKQAIRAIRDGRAAEVYIAADAAKMVTEPVREAAREAGVPVRDVPSMRELGRACSLDVGCACAARIKSA